MLKVVDDANWKWLAREPTLSRTVPPPSFLRFMGSRWNGAGKLKSGPETEDTQDSELNVNHTTTHKANAVPTGNGVLDFVDDLHRLSA